MGVVYAGNGGILRSTTGGVAGNDACCCVTCETLGDSITATISGIASAGCIAAGSDGANVTDVSINGVYTLAKQMDGSWLATPNIKIATLNFYAALDCSGSPESSQDVNLLSIRVTCIDPDALTVSLITDTLSMTSGGSGAIGDAIPLSAIGEPGFVPFTAGTITIEP